MFLVEAVEVPVVPVGIPVVPAQIPVNPVGALSQQETLEETL